MQSSGVIRWSGLVALLGGVLWIPYGVFEMLQPWGADTVYRDEPGYELVIDALLYRVYSLPGSLALLLTSMGLLGVLARLRLPVGFIGRIGRILAYVALALSALSVVGVIALFDPLFTAPRILGTFALGAASFLAGVDARRGGAGPGWTMMLLVLGIVGLLLLPLWPVVYALQWATEGVGTALIALFGLGWVLLGYSLWSVAREGAGYRPPVTGQISR